MTASYVFDIDPFADPFEDPVVSPAAAPDAVGAEAPLPAAVRPAAARPATDELPAPALHADPAIPAAPLSGGGEVVALADALVAAGYRQSAMALLQADGTPEAQTCAAAWQRVAAADTRLAERVARSGLPMLPSVQVAEDGTPRFVIVGTTERLVSACHEEHGPTGVLPELRQFLDEALSSGDVFVDAAPGLGFAALGAATWITPVDVVAATDDAALRDDLRQSACATGCATRIHFADVAEWAPAAIARLADHGLVMLHAGEAAHVAPLLSVGQALLRGDRIGVVAWRCGTPTRPAEGTEVAAAVLGVLGFRHFALAQRDGIAELVPTDAVATNDYVFSVAPAFIARSDR
ncbi:MAG: hypothetical protein ACK54K_06750 [Gemmatimonadaceae bacterium]